MLRKHLVLLLFFWLLSFIRPGFVCDVFGGQSTTVVIQRSVWSYDASDFEWHAGKEPAKKEGELSGASGWAEYKFEVESDGWYELFFQSIGGSKDIFLDGKFIYQGVSEQEDREPPAKNYLNVFNDKMVNLFLSSGGHTLRIRALNWPGFYLSGWELRAANGAPEGSIFAEVQGYNIIRAGEYLKLNITGGTNHPETYELMARNTLTGGNWKQVGTVSFPVSSKPVVRAIKIKCSEEGVFQLTGRTGDKILRPADFHAGKFVVVDTQNTPQASKNPKKTLLHEIDCTAQTDLGQPIKPNEGFWEANGATRITKSPAGVYRESGDNLDPDIPTVPGTGYKSFTGFSYTIDVPEVQKPYLLEVNYPDDERRTVNVMILQRAPQNAYAAVYPVAQPGSGYETGDWFPLSYQMLNHQVIFWPEYKELRVALITPIPGMRAAASKIRVSKLEEGLPAGPSGRLDGRLFASYMEEMGRWDVHFRSGGTIEKDFVGIERWVQICRYTGLNALWPTEAIYGMPTYNSRVLEGWFARPYDAPRIVALICEKYGLKYIPELHITDQYGFRTWVMDKLTSNPDQLYTYNRLGTRGGNNLWAPVYNALHPAVQQKYLEIVGELVDKVGDSPALAGFSSRLMPWCWSSYNGLASLNWGYEDWTINQFEKETGLRVPGKPDDPNRFQERFTFLTSAEMRTKWLNWRCSKMLDFYRRLRDRIRQNHPGAVLYLTYFPGNGGRALDNLFNRPLTVTEAEGLAEVGIDLGMLAKEPGIVVVPYGGFGRPGGTPVSDQSNYDQYLDPLHKLLGFGYERAFLYFDNYFEGHRQYPIDKLGFPELQPGDGGSAADAGGFNALEKLSVVLADQDTGTMVQGGWGYTFGQADYLYEWLAEYKKLPRLPFIPLPQGRDPVAVWYQDCPDGFYFYAVNREQYPVNVILGLDGSKKVTALGTGTDILLDKGHLVLNLKSYQLCAFKTNNNARIVSCEEKVPPQEVNLVKQRLAFCQQLADNITTGVRRDDVTEQERQAFLHQLDLAWEAFKQDHYWRTRTLLSMTPMITVFDKLADYPEGQLHRGLPDKLKTGNAGRRDLPATPMLTAAELMKYLVPGSQVELVPSTAYNSNWQHDQVLKSDSGNIDLEVQIPVPGLYRISLGHVAKTYGAITVSLNEQGLPLLAQTKVLNQPERSVFPAVSLSGGPARLSLRRQGEIGLYGVTLEPVYHPLAANLWMTIGPFPSLWDKNSGAEWAKTGMDQKFPPEEELNFAAAYTGSKKQPVRWEYDADTKNVFMDKGVNFLFRSRVPQAEICYAVTFITSPENRKAHLLIGCDWWANVYLNGELVVSTRDPKRSMIDGAQFNDWTPTLAAITLKKGVNILLVKNQGGSIANWFTAFITDPADLTFSPKPPGEMTTSVPETASNRENTKAEYPFVELTNGVLDVLVYLPDPEKGYYRGPRFDWSGMISRVRYNGHVYFTELTSSHNPVAGEGAVGPAEEFGMGIFGMPAPLCYNEAKPQETFIKIGVGFLEKTEKPGYQFDYPYRIVKPGVWKIKKGKDWIEFQQEMSNAQGYAYTYTKKITLPRQKPEIVITHFLGNTGTKVIETTHYSHNFFNIDEQPIGPDYLVKFAFKVKTKQSLGGIAEVKADKREIGFNREIAEKEAVFSELEGYQGTVKENETLIENKKTGTGIRIKGDLPVCQYNFYAARSIVCPEPFVEIRLKPGQSKEWQTVYSLL